MDNKKTIILGISGASGAVYARRILQGLVEAQCRIYLVISPAGRRLLHDELGIEQPDPTAILGDAAEHDITVLPYNDIGACIASGSHPIDAMIVAPCSSNKLAQIANGLSENLIARAAQVTLKERRPLILLHREMPLSLIELRNMVQATEAGAIVCPASPGFYLNPQSIDDLITMIAGRVLDLIHVSHPWNTRWPGAGSRREKA
ncbi:MAG TPA: UbiX family flavin prenyltransferase [Phycisphaerae bacterium]|nr:UbiX family flavin prenyltransferase [Phycisphaerae bacterium]